MSDQWKYKPYAPCKAKDARIWLYGTPHSVTAPEQATIWVRMEISETRPPRKECDEAYM